MSASASLGQTDSPHQIMETRIGVQRLELWTYFQVNQVEGSFLVRPFQLLKRLLPLTKGRINCRELIRRHIASRGKLLQFVKYSVCLVSLACFCIGVPEGCD